MNVRLLATAVAAVVLGSCSVSGAAGSPHATTASSGSAATTSSAVTSSTAATTATTKLTPTKVTKVLVVVVENHSLAQMQSSMPYTFSLAKRYGYADHYTAIRHPSLPNYLAIASGSTHGVTDDRDPSAHRLHGATVFGTAVAARRTAGVYADAMGASCRTTSEGRYAVRHNPWAYFVDERVACQKYDRPMGSFTTAVRSGTLPAAGMLVPDLCHDAHDCSLATADAWFRDRMRSITAGPDWRSGRLVVVLTADEDDRTDGNRVLTVVAHPALSHVVVHTPMTHYSLTRLYAEVTHTRALGAGVSAPSMARAFGLRTS